MNRKKLYAALCLLGFIILLLLPLTNAGQAQKPAPGKEGKEENGFSLKDLIIIGVAVLSLLLNFYLLLRRRRDTRDNKIAELEGEAEYQDRVREKEGQTLEEDYCDALREELGTIHLPGSPDIDCKAVKLEEAFVSLTVSETWRSERRFDPHSPQEKVKSAEIEMQPERHLSAEEVMKRAYQHYRLLLVIGDPGSGKTTLLKYYTVLCLDKTKPAYRDLGLPANVLPIYFPLRELEFRVKEGQSVIVQASSETMNITKSFCGGSRGAVFSKKAPLAAGGKNVIPGQAQEETGEPVSLPEALAKWCQGHLLDIPARQFQDWLGRRNTLVLLDGLDEIGSKERRRQVCQWVKKMAAGLKNARFVVTSRATGYRKLDGIELEMPHLRADIMDFSPRLQEEFLSKWFKAVFLAELPPKDTPHDRWQEQQIQRAGQKSQTMIEFLNKEENKTVRELAAVPMLLQIMAIIWKNRQYLPRTRVELFEVALNYLLDYRDRHKGIEPFLPVDESRRVLAPTALWMQEELQRDEAPKETMHLTLQEHLDTLQTQPEAALFCEFLRDRAGVIADYDKDHYIFRHKSFREFLAGMQLKENANEEGRLETLIRHFPEDWWEESLRFFISKSNEKIFDRFMREFFQSEVSLQLDAHRQNLLQLLVTEAPQKKVDALAAWLNSGELNSNQARYLMDCLKTIGTPEAIAAVAKADKTKMDKESRKYAEDIAAEAPAKPGIQREIPGEKDLEALDAFRNPLEDNVEYIKIPGGNYEFSVTKKMVTVPELWFCKYPVTNKRYRRFIAYLEKKDREIEANLPLNRFAERLLGFAESVTGYKEHLGNNPVKWREILRPREEDDRKFNGDDQPVVRVTWYAARAYCFWLSCLEAAQKGDNRLENTKRLAEIYRLPTEMEWEWAAGGNPDGSVRLYPWPEDKGEPNPNLANYNQNVGATTPVGRYPEGATPRGLMDMAGNVWEWMENLYREDKEWRSLRGGSWWDKAGGLRCSARGNDIPGLGSLNYGFRVLRVQS